MTTRSIPFPQHAGWFPGPRAGFAQKLGASTVMLFVCLCLLAPGLNFGNNIFTLKAEVLFLPIAVAAYTWLLLAGSAALIRFNGMMLAGLLFCLCICLSLLYGSLGLGHPFLLRDAYEIPKACLPVLFFTIGLEANLHEKSFRRVFDFLAGSLLLVCGFGWVQFFRLPFAHSLDRFYTAGEHVDWTLKVLNRVYSTMGNPNVLGQLMDWSIAAFLLALFLGVGSRLRNLLVLAACFVTLAMTASRYGMLGAVLDLLLILALFLPSFRNQRRVLQLALLASSLPFFLLIFRIVEGSTFGVSQRFEELRHPLQVDSLRMRLDVVWQDALAFIATSPWLGHGPAKEVFSTVVTDSEYLDVLKQFGVVGFLPYLAYFFVPLALVYRGLRAIWLSKDRLAEQLPAASLAAHLAFVMGVTALFMNVGESTMRNAPLQGFLWLWLGLGAGAARTLCQCCHQGFLSARPLTSGVNHQVAPATTEGVRS
jgi:O-antigen ligase